MGSLAQAFGGIVADAQEQEEERNRLKDRVRSVSPDRSPRDRSPRDRSPRRERSTGAKAGQAGSGSGSPDSGSPPGSPRGGSPKATYVSWPQSRMSNTSSLVITTVLPTHVLDAIKHGIPKYIVRWKDQRKSYIKIKTDLHLQDNATRSFCTQSQ
jgi:hypothetical protein